jgi:hypothetical protein
MPRREGPSLGSRDLPLIRRAQSDRHPPLRIFCCPAQQLFAIADRFFHRAWTLEDKGEGRNAVLEVLDDRVDKSDGRHSPGLGAAANFAANRVAWTLPIKAVFCGDDKISPASGGLPDIMPSAGADSPASDTYQRKRPSRSPHVCEADGLVGETTGRIYIVNSVC